MLKGIVDHGRDMWKELLRGSKNVKKSTDKKLRRIEFGPSMEQI